MYTYKAFIQRIVDADTMDVFIDLGFSAYTKQRIRLLGVQAPERYTTEGKAATEWVEEWLAEVDNKVILNSYKKDSFGRWLTTIKTKTGLDLCDAMLEAGIAEVYKKK
jgi:micrococcal nuclease